MLSLLAMRIPANKSRAHDRCSILGLSSWSPSWPLSLGGSRGKEGVAEMVAPVFFYIEGNGVGKVLVQQYKRVCWRIHAVHPVAFHADQILAIAGKVVHHFAALGGQCFDD